MNRMPDPLTRRLAPAALCLALAACAQPSAAPPTSTAAPTAPQVAAAPAAAAPASAAPRAAAAPAVDPGVLKALERMGAYLRTLKNFEVTVNGTTDFMLDNDQVVQVAASSRIKVRRPDGLLADSTNDAGDHRMFYFNGKTATVYDPDVKYYATVPAPATIKEVAQVLNDRYGIELPALDLFAWGTDQVDTSRIRAADFLGVVMIDGRPADHFALRQEGFDWQVWVEHGRTPVPRKLVIVTTSDPARPQHAIQMRWNLAPRFAANTFEFKPPTGAQRIAIRQVDGTVEAPAR